MVTWGLCLHNNVYNVEKMIKDFEEKGSVIFTYGNHSKYTCIGKGDPIHIYYKNQCVFVGKIYFTLRGGSTYNIDKYYRRRVDTFSTKLKPARFDIQILLDKKGDLEPLKRKVFTGIDVI